jgi:hypothetical protein
MTEEEALRELVVALRGLAANNQKTAAAMMGFARVICRDVIALCDAGPADRHIVARGARARAERVLADLGDDERAH